MSAARSAEARNSASVETELKLLVTEAAMAALPLAASLRDLPRRVVRLDAIYFDTSDCLLRRHGMALRLRRAGRQWAQTLKTDRTTAPRGEGGKVAGPGAAIGGLSARTEWECVLPVRTGEPRVDRARLRATPAAALLRAHPKAGPLLPLFRVRVRRMLWEVRTDATSIEVALDQGRIDARPAGRRASVPVAELELELKQGRPEDLIALALELMGNGSGRAALPLVPVTSSKAERGYRLAAGASSPVAKASARGFVAMLQADLGVGAALRAVVAHGLHVLLANAEGLRGEYDVEHVHQARVALRRVRSALRQLDRAGRDFPAPLAAELQWIARELGGARDGDVLVDHTLPLLTATVPAELKPAAAAMLARARARRDAARRRTAAALLTPRFARCALQLQAWTLTVPRRSGRPLARLAPRVLEQAHSRMFEAAPFFTALSTERRHRVRILAKRLRYALDILTVALPPTTVEPYTEALAELQDVLGALNDAAVVMAELPHLTRSRALLGYAQQWHDQHERPLLLDAEKRLLALLESAKPWARQRSGKRQAEDDADQQDPRPRPAVESRTRGRSRKAENTTSSA